MLEFLTVDDEHWHQQDFVIVVDAEDVVMRANAVLVLLTRVCVSAEEVWGDNCDRNWSHARDEAEDSKQLGAFELSVEHIVLQEGDVVLLHFVASEVSVREPSILPHRLQSALEAIS